MGLQLGGGQGLRPEHFFEAIARFAGRDYLRYSFTKGTGTEVRFLSEVLGLKRGELVLDVGCGPGRHSRALSALGARVTGVDVAWDFVRLAAEDACARSSFVRGDARLLPVRNASFDVVICLCQGGFGLLGGGADESLALAEMSAALRDGGRMALGVVSAYFAIHHLEEGDSFDAGSGVNHEVAAVRGDGGRERPFELWTTCFTPRELRLMLDACGLEVVHLWSVGPGDYGMHAPDLSRPELLVIAEKRPSRRHRTRR